MLSSNHVSIKSLAKLKQAKDHLIYVPLIWNNQFIVDAVEQVIDLKGMDLTLTGEEMNKDQLRRAVSLLVLDKGKYKF